MFKSKIIPYYIIALATFIAIAVGNINNSLVFGDLIVYEKWTEKSLDSQIFWGLNETWVYPYVAFIPMALAKATTVFGLSYYTGWLLMLFILNILAVYFFQKRFEISKYSPYLVWGLLTILVGGIFLARIDGVAIALTIIGISIFKKYPNVGIFILIFATWIKIWPIAFLLGLIVVSRKPIIALAKSAAVGISFVILPLLIGFKIENILSFISTQGDRGIQVESLFAIPFINVPDSFKYNYDILTYQVETNDISSVIMVSNVLLIVGLIFAILISLLVIKNGSLESAILVGLLVLSILILFNKVGSPQFIGWLIIPAIFLCQIDFKKYWLLIFAIFSVTIFNGAIIFNYGQILAQTSIGNILLLGKFASLTLISLLAVVYLVKINKDMKKSVESK